MGISSAGIGSGLDVNSLVSQLLELEKKPLNGLTSKKSAANDQISAYGRIKSDLDAFKSAAADLQTDLDFAATKASSSNTDILSATTDSTAVAGTYDIKVSSLAQAGVKSSTGFSSASTAIGAASFDNGQGPSTLTFSSGGKSFDISVSATDTLETIRDKINSAVLDGETSSQKMASATVVNAGTSANPSYKLVISATGKGVENDVTISTSDNALQSYFGFSTAQAATNASLTVNGLPIERSSNKVTDIIDGVTLDLASADAGKTVTLTVARDTETITKKINDFVSAYNKLADTIRTLHKKGGTLEADNSATSVIYQLQNTFNEPASIAGNSYSWLSQIGITFKKDGSLSVDSSTFTKALQTDFSNVVSLFTDTDRGMAHRLYSAASNMLDTNGLVDSRISGLNSRVKSIDNSMDRENLRLDNIEKRLRTQYAKLDATLGTMKNTSNYLSSLLR